MNAVCPQCSSIAALCLQTTDLNQKIDKVIFDYYRCTQCKLIFLEPFPENPSNYFPSNRHRTPYSLEQLVQLAKKLHWRVELVQKYKSGGSLLEIGSSFGAFAYEAASSGFRVEAIEMDKSCCDFINATTEVTAINTTDIVQTMAARNKTYDVIALWHSIEHIPNPWAVLKQCASQLAPRGLLVISTPNPDSIQFKLFKRYWMHLDAPRHAELIPPALLTDYLKREGMQLVFTTTNDPDGLVLDRIGWYHSVKHLLGVSSEKNMANRIISKILFLTISPIERWMQRGAAYTAMYQKK